MALTRITQNMMMDRSYNALQTGLNRLAKTQEHLSTGRVLNRPSDSPTDTTSAMRIRASLADQKQYLRNTDDGIGWLGQIDSTLTTVASQIRKARELGIQGANDANASPQAREALAVEVEQIRESLISAANASYLGRPVFGGVVDGQKAYAPDGSFVGVAGDVSRTVARGVKVPVNVDGPDVFGPDGANLFDDLGNLAASLRGSGPVPLGDVLDNLHTALTRVTSTLGDVGARYNRLDRARLAAEDLTLSLTSSLAQVENVDLAKATMDLKLNEVAYQAGLAATARLVQPSLSDFLR
jgi:flagellar hook-associated protein 3 FlgL